MHKILITGAAGLLGRVLVGGLDERYAVSGIDRTGSRGGQVSRVDMSKPKGLDSLFDGFDTVIDLAALPSERTSWSEVWRNNLPATMNALEAAQRGGVRRYVFVS